MRGVTTANHKTKARLGDQIADLFAKLKPTGLTSRASRRGPLLRALKVCPESAHTARGTGPYLI